MKYTSLATFNGLPEFLQEYHKQLAVTRNFPPLSTSKALNIAATIFNFSDWHVMSAKLPKPFPTDFDEIQQHSVFERYRKQCDLSKEYENKALETNEIDLKVQYLILSLMFHGDNDELAMKHVAHSFAAIMAGKTWMHGIDYLHPGRPYPNLKECPDGDEDIWYDFYSANLSHERWSIRFVMIWAQLSDAINAIGIKNAVMIADQMRCASPTDYYERYDYPVLYS
jgi:hypothetical protein